MAGQEGVHLLRAENQRVLACAETRLPEKQLGERALYPEPGPRQGGGSRGLLGPSKASCQDRDDPAGKKQGSEY